MKPQALRPYLGVLLLLAMAGSAAAAGMLMPRDGRPGIAVKSHRVTAVVEDGIARTTLRQTFVNPYAGSLEAIYSFPLPEGAALVDVAMEVGGQRLEGLLAERQKARAVYNQIVNSQRDPALVEQVGRTQFRLSVFPVVPKQDTVVELSWIQRVPLTNGAFRYVYPLADATAAVTTLADFTFSITLKSSLPFTEVTSPTAGMDVVRRAPGEAVASLERSQATLADDVVVIANVQVDTATMSLISWQDEQADGYFLLTVTPPQAREDELIPRDVILVLDTSGSMNGEKIEQARSSALYLLSRLHPRDRVNVLRFSSTVVSFAGAPVAATPENLQNLREFVNQMRAEGSTALGDALLAVASWSAGEAAPGRVRTVVLLSDGAPTVGEQDPGKLIAMARLAGDSGIRIFPFGVGADAAGGLLRGLAQAGRGRAEIFRPGGEVESRLTAFIDRIAAPVISDLQLSMPEAGSYDVFPRPLPDAYLGEQVAIAGRYRVGGPQTVTVTAHVGGEARQLSAQMDFRTTPGGSLAARDLFAHQKLSYLEEQLRLREGLSDEAYFAALDRGGYSTGGEVIQEIIACSIETRVQCPYTSFIVLLPEDRKRIDPRSLSELEGASERARLARGGEGTPAGEDVWASAPVAPDLTTDKPFEGRGFLSNLGMSGGGGGGTFGGRFGGRRDLVARGGGSSRTESAVELGLAWLSGHQAVEEGRLVTNPEEIEDTALALLAFLGAGNTHRTGAYKDWVKEALRSLSAVQSPEGSLGPDGTDLRVHAVATLAVCEAYALSGKTPMLQGQAQRAIDYLTAAQNPMLGWGHAPRDGSNDTRVTGWAIMALKSARVAGLSVPKESLSGALTYFDKVTDETTGLVAGGRDAAGNLVETQPSAEWIGTMMLNRIFLGTKRSDPVLQVGAARLVEHLPAWTPDGNFDLLACYAGTLAMFQVGGDAWKQWNEALRAALLDKQVTTGDDRGAWNLPATSGISRARATALATLSLEVYYRYGKVFK